MLYTQFNILIPYLYTYIQYLPYVKAEALL